MVDDRLIGALRRCAPIELAAISTGLTAWPQTIPGLTIFPGSNPISNATSHHEFPPASLPSGATGGPVSSWAGPHSDLRSSPFRPGSTADRVHEPVRPQRRHLGSVHPALARQPTGRRDPVGRRVLPAVHLLGHHRPPGQQTPTPSPSLLVSATSRGEPRNRWIATRYHPGRRLRGLRGYAFPPHCPTSPCSKDTLSSSRCRPRSWPPPAPCCPSS